ncbi:MAG: valine--tRNA ligase, partial [Candidatus Saganbacteria bacterium]|nr:valine--tRNA ligase [Candidatus Saganbacteria bacterium]
KYPIEDSKDFVIVATTRPETMLGDTAVAVNPHDERYKNLVGKTLILPLVERKIPLIKDEFVDPSFGTGAVKVTPAHDPNDFEIGIRHNLPRVNMLTKNAKVDLGEFDEEEKKRLEAFKGMDRSKAREKIVADLTAQGLIEKIEDYLTPISHCYRCKTAIEPYLSDQWFVKVSDLARTAIAAVEEEKIKFVPERWKKVYLDWMVNLKDWCVSRQIWWGHRIPVWYCECGETIVSEETPEKCPKCSSSKLTQDSDVLDTWFSSALWPFSTLGWPEKTEDLKTFYPTSVLVTAYDILTFWVSRMIMMGLKFMDEVPFHTVYIHGLIRDVTGKKMSKSLGNVIDPVDVIDHAGADALRFALISLVTGQGQDIKLSEEKITECRNFANKLWNVSRFIFMAMEPETERLGSRNREVYLPVRQAGSQVPVISEFEDKWILSKYNHTILTVTSLLEEYDFGEAARKLYEFLWGDFCDWYVELIKARIYSKDKETRGKALKILVYVLEGTLRMLHPFMPFITEEIWGALGVDKLLIISGWPKAEGKFIDKKVDLEMQKIMDVIRSIRNIRAEVGVPQKKEAEVILVASGSDDRKILEEAKNHIINLCNAADVKIEKSLKKKPENSATAVASGIEIYMPLAGLIDIEKEVKRLKDEVEKIEEEIEKVETKLLNKQFILRANPEAVQKDRAKEEELKKKKEIIISQLRSLSS